MEGRREKGGLLNSHEKCDSVSALQSSVHDLRPHYQCTLAMFFRPRPKIHPGKVDFNPIFGTCIP